MKGEDKGIIAAARQTALEAESHISVALGSLALVRSALARVEEENRELRVEAAKREMQFYTEPEFAKLLKVSVATLARLRHKFKIEPPPYIGHQVRYSNVHLERVYEMFDDNRKRKSRKT